MKEKGISTILNSVTCLWDMGNQQLPQVEWLFLSKKFDVPWVKALSERRKHLLGPIYSLVHNLSVSYSPYFPDKKTEAHED